MTPLQLKRAKETLVALRDELTGKAPSKIAPNRRDETEVGGDEDEQPLNEMMQSIASNRNRNAAGVVQKIDKALAKLRDDPDEYGLCEDCGDELGAGRLKAMPHAELCVDCQAKHDGPKGPVTRRSTRDFR